MKVLLVDDDSGKASAIEEAVREACVSNALEIIVVKALDRARRELATNHIDVLILDIAVPHREDLEPDPEGGAWLLEELVDGGTGLMMPGHIIGVTAYEYAYRAAVDTFSSVLLTLLRFDANGTWIDPLQARLRQIEASLSLRASEAPEYRCDLAAIVALQSPELTAVRSLPWHWREHIEPEDHTLYWAGTFGENNSRKAIAAASARMGIAAACALASKVIQQHRPRQLVLAGIAAGVRGKVALGDVVVADPCWDWGSGKLSADSEVGPFAQAPHQVPLDPNLREAAMDVARDSAALAEIRDRWPGAKPATVLQVHVGPMASGAAVVSDAEKMREIVAQHRQLLAVEMEGYGVAVAAQECTAPRPGALVVKGVVDFGDAQKDDSVREYAAFASAEVMSLCMSRLYARRGR